MGDHDHSYKELFSEPRMVEDLLKGFVEGEWVKRLDFSTLDRVSGSFINEKWKERENDILWRLRFTDQSWLYVYLLLEFQSTPQPLMALRVMVYVGLLYQDLVAQKVVKGDEKLPPVMPIVLYNGKKPWNAAREVSELIQSVEGLEDYRPRQRYLLLEEMRYPSEKLKSLKNLVAALFRLEQSQTREDVREVVDCLLQWLGEPEQKELRRRFASWIRRVVLPARVKGAVLPEVAELSEVRTMLEETVIQWTEEWKRQGLEQGLEQGRRESRLKETQRLLSRLEKKFGELSSEQRGRLESADPDLLLDLLLGVRSLEDF